MKNFCICLGIILCFNLPSFSQETTKEEDPFSEYSYLWETDGKKKKDKKSKTEETTTTVTALPDSTQTVQTPTDSTSTASPTIEELPLAETDSLKVVEPEILEPAIVATDSTSNEPSMEDLALDQEQIVQDSLNQIAKQEKKDARKEKTKDQKEAKDFRSGLSPANASSSINGGFTFSVIDGKSYAGLVLAPELSLGKVGVGIDVPILYGLEDKAIRTEMFKEGVGALRLIRYVRVGRQKVDPVYVKMGVLSGTMIGYGGLINNYTNSTSYEKRKTGLHYDVNIKGYGGIEGMYSDFDPSSLNLFVMRPYVRPLKWLPTPIIRSLEIGATFVKDKDQTTLTTREDGSALKYGFTKDGIGAFGLDAGMTLLSIPFIQIDLFANYSKLNVSSDSLLSVIDAFNTADQALIAKDDFVNGKGSSYGLNFRFHFIADLLSTDVRIERLNYTDNFRPQFFDTSYEMNKDARIYSLTSGVKKSGIYGSLTGHILKIMKLGGSLMIPDSYGEDAPATIMLHADVERFADKISIHANYFKTELDDLGDAFKLDERSVAKVRFIYHLNKFLVTGLDYFYTFDRLDDGGVKTTQYVSPYFGLNIQL